ncbi:MAG: fasciclin domain-containing protein [Paludibacter sp.]|nr:fasciclin domain-containing protein [Paludibacter sp.]
MKKNVIENQIKKLFCFLLLTLSFIFSLTSCYNSDDVKGNIYTANEKNLGQYLKADSAEYSEFSKLLDTTEVLGVLNSYGTYTCFAPDNNAMRNYYALKGKSKLSDFSLDSLRLIAYDHIINKDSIYSTSFISGRLSSQTMSERYITISFQSDSIFVNKISRIIEKDIKVHNGVIHKISKVLNPSRLGVVELISQDKNFKIFYEALLTTGLADSLLKEKDTNYDPTKYSTSVVKDNWVFHKLSVPSARKFGYTLFMESDATFLNYGVTDLTSLKVIAANIYDKTFPEDANVTNITDSRNSLNRFVAYHILQRNIDVSKLIDAYDCQHMLKTIDMYEYFETMCSNTLIEVSKIRSLGTTGTNQINRLPETGEAVHITSNNNIQATNGIYHEIDKLLCYYKSVDEMLSSKRLRFDGASFFDELANNNMRGQPMTTYSQNNNGYYLPKGYLNRLKCSDQTSLVYLTSFAPYLDYEGDELWLVAQSGKLYDFTVTTPPVPAGTYEVRFGYQPTGLRGVAQFYFDDMPAGLPVNLSNFANSTSVGWEKPGSVAEDPFGYQNDKVLRNRGYMKGPASFTVPDTRWYSGPARISVNYLRKIFGTFNFDKAGTHTITVKGLSNGEFVLDFVEFVPTSAIETEDIY